MLGLRARRASDLWGPTRLAAHRHPVGARGGAETTPNVGAGIASRANLRRAGFTPREVHAAVSTGALAPLTHGWYATAPMDDRMLLRSLGHVLPGDAVFAGPTAALLHGVEVAEASLRPGPIRLSVVREPGSRALRRPGLSCRVMQMEAGDVCEVHGVRVTSPLRTALDLAASSPLPRAVAVLEAFVRAGIVSTCEIAERVRHMAGRRGVRVLREALSVMDARSESPPETAVRLRLDEAGLPDVVPQRPVRVPGHSAPLRLDIGVVAEGRKVAVEYFSDAFHPREGPVAVHDAARLDMIRREGWETVVVRAEDLRGEERNFEDDVARKLGRTPRGGPRRRWTTTRFNLYRNAWTRITSPTWSEWPLRGGTT